VIEPGQLRRWKEDVDGIEGDFLVLRSQGKFFPMGMRRTDGKQDHWELLTVDGHMTGWSDELLNTLSEPINEAR
jgi:hypothetical protein